MANAARRALRLGETDVVPRVSDLEALAVVDAGKVEIEIARGGPRRQIVEHLLKAAVLTVFQERCRHRASSATCIDAFDDGRGRARRRGRRRRPTTSTCVERGARRCASPVGELTGGDERPAAVASAVEFMLEGLHLVEAAQQGRRRRPRHLPRRG